MNHSSCENKVSTEQSYITLSELNEIIKDTISTAFSQSRWIIAEIAELKVNHNGHCYIELVEMKNDNKIASIKATIWKSKYNELSAKFLSVTGFPLSQGNKILFLAQVRFHSVYGLSLEILDINPTFSLGDLEKRKREILNRLKREKLIDLNKSRELPPVIQSIAIVSSSKAAGYHDLISCLYDNPYHYRFTCYLFEATMQGEQAEASITKALQSINKAPSHFDAVVIVRGGGSTLDLNCFNSYNIAKAIATSPYPVITGIGHEKDDSIADAVAHTRLGQPRAVAEFIIRKAKEFEIKINDLTARIMSNARSKTTSFQSGLISLSHRIHSSVLQFVPSKRDHINEAMHSLHVHTKQFLGNNRNSLDESASKIHASVLRLIPPKRNSIDKALHLLQLQPKQLLRDNRSFLDISTSRIQKSASDLIKKRLSGITNASHSLTVRTIKSIHEPEKTIDQLRDKLNMNTTFLINSLRQRLDKTETEVKHLDPINVLKRGYSITTVNGKVVKSVEDVNEGNTITTLLQDGSLISILKARQKGGQ